MHYHILRSLSSSQARCHLDLHHVCSTTSSQCNADQSTGLDLLAFEGLNHAHASSFPVPHSAIPHLVGEAVGKGGRTVYEAGDRLDVIIGTIDGV